MEAQVAKKKKIEEGLGGGSDGSHGQAESSDQGLTVSTPMVSHIDIFGNQLIFRIVGDHLSVSDLKSLSLTCELLLDMVSEHRGFESQRITVTDETIYEKILDEQGSVRGLELNSARIVIDLLSTASHAEQWIPCPSLDHLEIYHSLHREWSHCLPPVYKVPEKLPHHRGRIQLSTVYKCLQSSELNLVSFTLDLRLWIYEYSADQLSLALTQVVKTVKELNFVCHLDSWNLTENEDTNFKNNAHNIQSLPWQLRSFSVAACPPLHYPLPNELPLCIVKILSSNTATIERIKLGKAVSYSLRPHYGLQGITFSRLKELSVSIGQEDRLFFADFLSLQPKLESLRLTVWGTMDLSLQEAILGNCSPRMHTLVFNDEKDCPPIAQFNFESWAFLQDLSGLKKFRIKAGSSEVDTNTVLDILRHLPPTLLFLDIGAEMYQFFVSAVRPHKEIMPLLSGFLQMSHLKLRNYDYLLDDDALQSICRNMTQLRYLDFCTNLISDFGLTGKKVGMLSRAWTTLHNLASNFVDINPVSLDTGVSLRNLKSLRELVLLSSSRDQKITKEGLVSAIHFLELKSLALPVENIPDAIMVQIASNNPSLESITRTVSIDLELSNLNQFSHPHLFQSILTVNPRVRKIETIIKRWWAPQRAGYITCPSYHVLHRPGLPSHHYSGFL